MSTQQIEVIHNVTTVEVTDGPAATNVEVIGQPAISVEVATVGTQGSAGPAGPANNLSIGEIIISDDIAAAEITGFSPNQILSLTIPRGTKGDTGAQGPVGPAGPPGTITSVNGLTGSSITLTKSHIGLGSVDNTADLDKPLSNASTTALATKMNKIISGGTGTTSYRRVNDIFDGFISTPDIAGSLVIQTNIPFANHMTALHITGYNYSSSTSVIDLWVNFYAYSVGPQFPTHNAMNYGTYKPAQVRLMRRTSDNMVVIVIDPGPSGDWDYPRIHIDGLFGYTAPSDAAFSGWTASVTSDLSAFTTMVTTTLGANEPFVTAGTTSQYRRGDKTWQTLDKTAVGLGNVANTAQVDLINAQTIAGAKTFTSLTQINNLLSLKSQTGSDSVYLQLFAREATPSTRTGYIGFGTAGGNTMTLINEISGGALNISTTGNGNITLNAGTGNVTATGILYEGANRVYSSANKPTPAALGAEPTITAGTTSQFWRGDKTWQALTAASISDFNEAAQDTVASMLTSGTNIGISYNDASNTLTISTTATINSTDAQLRDRTTHTGAQAISTVTGLQAALDTKAPIESPTFTGTVSGITKSMVGLANVDNTSDANKPISTATQTALNGKTSTTGGGQDVHVSGLPTTGTVTLNAANGNVHSSATLTGNITIAASNLGTGVCLLEYRAVQGSSAFTITMPTGTAMNAFAAPPAGKAFSIFMEWINGGSLRYWLSTQP